MVLLDRAKKFSKVGKGWVRVRVIAHSEPCVAEKLEG